MDKVLHDAEKYANSHQDNIIITSDTWPDHIMHIGDVVSHLRDANLVANASKTQFARVETKVLGVIVGKSVIRPDYEKVSAIVDFKAPTTKRKARAFLGVVNFYKKCIPNLFTRAFLLTDLTKKSNPEKFTMSADELQAFEDLKRTLVTDPVLWPPQPLRPYSVKSDALVYLI